MEINDLLEQTSEWLKGTGPQSEIVVSSRIRLARNLAKWSFAPKATKQTQQEVLKAVKEAMQEINMLRAALVLRVGDLDELDKQFLVERHLMSREHAVGPDPKGLVLTPDEIISVMINEEDHLRLQVMRSGLNLHECWQVANQLDEELAERLPYAFSDEWGYLTACPTNTGTGMRASVMVHLPALVLTKQINRVLQAIAKLSLTARGLYGEGTEASGNFFQISNQVTLGHTEEELIDNIERILKQVLEHERNAREALHTHDTVRLEDRIHRAFGTLRSAHIVSSGETLDLLSAVRLGVDLGLLRHLDRSIVNELFISTQPAHLQKLEGKKLSAAERDVKRAALIRKKLGG